MKRTWNWTWNWIGTRSIAITGNLLLSIAAVSFHSNPLFAQTAGAKEFDGFPAVRNEVLSLIGGATSRVRVVTDFLSDGEIVTGLYIAQYRKVNVQVLLGQARATNVLSRLNYLKAQNVPVWLRPRGFMPHYPTVLLVDDKLYTINADLDSMARHRRFSMTILADTEVGKFTDAFDTATSTGVSPTPRTTPLVGRPGARSKTTHVYRPDGDSASSNRGSQNAGAEESPADTAAKTGAYRYNRNREKPTNGIPTKLPKTTILQERERSRANGSHE